MKDKIQTEREKIMMLKNRYTQKLDEKAEMEKLLRKCINDYKQDLWEIKTNLRYMDKSEEDTIENKMRDNIKEILDKEKKLSLLHDKIFFTRKHTIKNDLQFQMA